MRTCPNCNFIIDNDNAKFCRKCGTRLPELQVIQNIEPEIISEPEPIAEHSDIDIVSEVNEYTEVAVQPESIYVETENNDTIELETEINNPIEVETESNGVIEVESENCIVVQQESYSQAEEVISVATSQEEQCESNDNFISVSYENAEEQQAEESVVEVTAEQNPTTTQHTPSNIDYAKAWKFIISGCVIIFIALLYMILPSSLYNSEWRKLKPNFSMSTPIESIRIDMNGIENDPIGYYFITFSEYPNSPEASITRYSVFPYENTIFDVGRSYYERRYNITNYYINGYGGDCVAQSVGDGIYEYTFSRPVYFSYKESEVNAPFRRIKVKIAEDYEW